jgi:hypothetical protein
MSIEAPINAGAITRGLAGLHHHGEGNPAGVVRLQSQIQEVGAS